ncbi:hypothetical protein [Streptomyces longwoodensis]|uniref:hypothetical protein n=1 Tax=Streptomyces longwoodensis TaxID=68231 RepID=UPI00381CA882
MAPTAFGEGVLHALGQLASGISQSGRVRGSDNALWVAAQAEENDEDHMSFQSLGGTVNSPAPIPDHRNLLHVFYRSTAAGQNRGASPRTGPDRTPDRQTQPAWAARGHGREP